jgi:glycosyltransferase involved in cell wall biosynthesis
MNERISIVVPIYNGERYLKECLDSLKIQDYPDIEVMLVDDGSTDLTADICRRYVSEDQRFHYIYQENSGQNAARKTGVEHASGDWVMFVDADDFVTADYCSSFMEMHHKTNADIIFGVIQRYQEGKYGRKSQSLSGVQSGKEVLENFLKPRFYEMQLGGVLFPALFLKKIILNSLRKIDRRIRYGEDWGCVLYSLLQAQEVAFLQQVKYFYRMNASSCNHLHVKSTVIDQKLLRRFLIQSISKTNFLKSVQKKIDWLIIQNLLLGGYEYFSDFPGLYPFKEIPSGKRIVIYGAGVFGEEMHDKFPRNLVHIGWVDRQYAYYQSQGKPVSPVEKLSLMDFDYVAIAITNPDTVDRIVQDLLDKNMPAEKILRIDEVLIDSDYTERKLKELEKVDENYRYVPAAVSPDSGK